MQVCLKGIYKVPHLTKLFFALFVNYIVNSKYLYKYLIVFGIPV